MPLVETESLVIKSYNLAEADKIVVLLTREHGMVRGVAKGAKRLKSKFGSGLEPFSIIRVEYFEKESSELVSIQKVDLVRSSFEAASNPDFLQKFSYLGDLLITFSPPHDPNETLYRMVRACIETGTNDAASIAATGVYFELWLLRLSGFMPDWGRCDGCGRGFSDDEDAAIMSDLHLKCSSCRRSTTSTISADTRLTAALARKVAPMEFARLTMERTESLRFLSDAMKRLISISIGREVAGEKSLAISG
jgi:DNA repair protein RecO (recombination protein O)